MADALRIDSAVEDSAAADDRQWFAARPRRRYRLRRRLPRELASDDDVTHVLVIQMFPGARTRRCVRCAGDVPPDCDDQLARLADLIYAGEAAYVVDGRVVGFDELPEWAIGRQRQ